MTAPRPTDWLLAVLGTLLLTLAFMASCAPLYTTDPYLIGGPMWRVFDANRITSPEALDALRREYEDVERCVGRTRPFPDAVYSVSAIMYRAERGWRGANGMWLSAERGGGRDRVHVRTTMPARHVRTTARHEFVHYLLQQPHPQADKMIALCDGRNG